MSLYRFIQDKVRLVCRLVHNCNLVKLETSVATPQNFTTPYKPKHINPGYKSRNDKSGDISSRGKKICRKIEKDQREWYIKTTHARGNHVVEKTVR